MVTVVLSMPFIVVDAMSHATFHKFNTVTDSTSHRSIIIQIVAFLYIHIWRWYFCRFLISCIIVRFDIICFKLVVHVTNFIVVDAISHVTSHKFNPLSDSARCWYLHQRILFFCWLLGKCVIVRFHIISFKLVLFTSFVAGCYYSCHIPQL